MNNNESHRPYHQLIKGLEERGWREVAANIALDHHATLFEVLTGNRLSHVVAARDAFIAHLREKNLTWNAIGALLDMDHTSCITAHKRHHLKIAAITLK